MPPRYFLPVGEPRALPTLPAAQLCHLFQVQGRELAVVRDGMGNLRVDPAAGLPPALLRAARQHELQSGGSHPVSVEDLWCFELQIVEVPGNPAGLNDPVELYGRMFGPFDAPEPPNVWEGRLAVTRADLLHGLVDHASRALSVQTDASIPGKCLHAWLPGDTAEALAGGRGAVLAFALLPVDVAPDHPANEALVADVLFDTLLRLRADLKAEGVAHPLLAAPLPVPDRERVVRELEAEGYTVQGDYALPNLGFSRRVVSALSAIFATEAELARLGRRIPAQGNLADYLRIAGEMLRTLRWPDERARALRTRVGPAIPLPVGGPRVPVPSVVTTNSAPAPTPAPAPAKRAVLPPTKTDWSADFGPGTKPAPVRTRPPRSERPGRVHRTINPPDPPSARPEWLDDFET